MFKRCGRWDNFLIKKYTLDLLSMMEKPPFTRCHFFPGGQRVREHGAQPGQQLSGPRNVRRQGRIRAVWTDERGHKLHPHRGLRQDHPALGEDDYSRLCLCSEPMSYLKKLAKVILTVEGHRASIFHFYFSERILAQLVALPGAVRADHHRFGKIGQPVPEVQAVRRAVRGDVSILNMKLHLLVAGSTALSYPWIFF